MDVADLQNALEAIAPLRLAAEWDNVGLLLGSPDWPASRILLTIDLTEPVLNEAIDAKADAIIAYHPPIFQPIRSLGDDSPRSRLLLRAAREEIAIYSPHTALDAAEGGINDWLAKALGPGDVRALRAAEHLPGTAETKVVTFCPAEAVDRLRAGLASVGAGQIGAYQQCSFEIKGTGTFFGTETSKPTLGQRGLLERVEEVRLEMVCPTRSLALAVLAIKQFHPYEEPPIEIYSLRPRPVRSAGEGRRIVLDRAASLRAILDRLRKGLGKSRLQVGEAFDKPKSYQTIGLCAGSGGSLLEDALREGCRLFFTGEMRHHDILEAMSRGCTIILAGHTNTERGYLKILKSRLSAMLKDVEIAVSRRDVDPLRVM